MNRSDRPELVRIRRRSRLERLWLERLTEPVHLNVISLGVALFGSFEAKVDFDLVRRPQYAFSLLNAAKNARRQGIGALTAIEFGVANGAGLLNMCRLADRVTRATGVRFSIFGLDSGTGMPPPCDYRDHPERFQEGDYPMDRQKLEAALPDNAKLVIGRIEDTVPEFIGTLSSDTPIGFVAIDVDYHSSAVSALRILEGDPELYLPALTVYLDDIDGEFSNPWCGELLAVSEFNERHGLRKISPFNLLECRRVFRNAQWLRKIYTAHIFDHPYRSPDRPRVAQRVLPSEPSRVPQPSAVR